MNQKPWLKYYRKDLPPNLDYPEITLPEVLRNSAEKHLKKTAIIYLGKRMSYKTLHEHTDRFSSALRKKGIERGDRVAILLPNIPQFVIAFYGALRAGATVVPCNPLYKEKELEFQLIDSEAEIIVVSNNIVRGQELFESIGKVRSRTRLKEVITTSVTDFASPLKKILAPLAGVKKREYPDTEDMMQLLERTKPERFSEKIDPRIDLAILQYTGGTTGISKGAMLTHRNLVANALMVANWLPMREADEVNIAAIPFFHIYGLTVAMNAPILRGNTIVLFPRFAPEEILKAIQKEKATVFCGVPTMYVAMCNHKNVKRYSLDTIRGCISGAAPLPKAVKETFDRLTSANLAEGYGLTEASPVTHCNPLDDRGKVRSGSIGLPFPDTDARIVALNDPSNELAVGEVGELAVKGPQVMMGYWKREDETKLVLRDGWLLTGDMAKMDSDGYFYIVDRKKELIDISGLKVWPREVEEVIFTHQAVEEAAVIGAPDHYRGEVVKAYVVLKKGLSATAEDIITHCKNRMASFKVPKIVEFRDELPHSLIGKVLKRELKEEIKSQQ